MNYHASKLLELQLLSAGGDKLAAGEIKRRKNLLVSLRNRLTRHLARPEPTTKIGTTMRARDARVLRKKIAALEAGLPVSRWHEMET